MSDAEQEAAGGDEHGKPFIFTARGALVVFGAIALVAIVALSALWFWPNRDDKAGGSSAVSIDRLSSITSEFPKGYSVRAGHSVYGAAQIAELKAAYNMGINPSKCAALSQKAAENLLGADLQAVDALSSSISYLITAQSIPSDHPDRTPLPADCDYMTKTTPDVQSIITRETPPQVPNVKATITASRTITTTKAGTAESFTYTAWLDGHHAVGLQVSATPEAGKPLAKIDTAEATRIFIKSVQLVAGK